MKLNNQFNLDHVISLVVSFILIYILGKLFSTGIQIYPPSKIPTERDPECSHINFLNSQIVEQQYRGFYSIQEYRFNYPDKIAPSVFRVFVKGPHFIQELRKPYFSGIYAVNQSTRTFHFELNQIGDSKFLIYCLNTKISETSADVQAFPRDLGYSRFHSDQPYVEKMCWNGSEMIGFSQSLLKSPPSSNSFLYPSLSLSDLKFQDYANQFEFQIEEHGTIFYLENSDHFERFKKTIEGRQKVFVRVNPEGKERIIQFLKPLLSDHVTILKDSHCWKIVEFLN